MCFLLKKIKYDLNQEQLTLIEYTAPSKTIEVFSGHEKSNKIGRLINDLNKIDNKVLTFIINLILIILNK